jgi:hypothetical protein
MNWARITWLACTLAVAGSTVPCAQARSWEQAFTARPHARAVNVAPQLDSDLLRAKGISPQPASSSPQAVVSHTSGFGWTDAGIGAAVTAFAFSLAGLAKRLRQRGRPAPGKPHAPSAAL